MQLYRLVFENLLGSSRSWVPSKILDRLILTNVISIQRNLFRFLCFRCTNDMVKLPNMLGLINVCACPNVTTEVGFSPDRWGISLWPLWVSTQKSPLGRFERVGSGISQLISGNGEERWSTSSSISFYTPPLLLRYHGGKASQCRGEERSCLKEEHFCMCRGVFFTDNEGVGGL